MRINSLLLAAETIRDWPAGQERLEQATRHVREAMYLCTVGKISQAEEAQVFWLLAFAMPESDSES